MERNEMIMLTQSPEIYYRLEEISKEVREKVDGINKLVVSDDTCSEVKKVRTSLKKEFEELETQRKMIKNAILEPYEEFEKAYKEKIVSIYKEADESLKTKIDSVENELKEKKTDELREFANKYFEHYDLEFCKFEDIPLNVTLTASMKSLKEKILEWCNARVNDIMVINQIEDREEMLYEYKTNGYNQSKAILTVRARKKALEEQQKKAEIQTQQQEQKEEMVEKIEEIIQAPVEIEEPIEVTTTTDEEKQYSVTFSVTTTLPKLKMLKEFLKNNEIDFH